ncbi:uncharacterized protein Z519_12722 [Cladophialophora bantiana CBS 173.52]|uniref:GDP/GTP exchange factor Sec2 N-terminal domain-containing protein n=1 Tax=Cladophialophora bantiana (strain ATCC 10958 / CBS 173.52 / CDC B-1940 / NIH 8579) TaxID=1442370 RepID=A0A0D2FIZ1_CLAB1|nr:uncharacterized protein Z519_12722 [Cladophialophora bantiana CBS 173.52]KIW86667.1 hypothetical protein Z519_12722 [Cladophialophora bantiana CBS 173.52]
MDTVEAPVIPAKDLPKPPPSGPHDIKRNGLHFPPPRSTARPGPQNSKPDTSTHTLLQIRALEAENRRLRAEVAKNYQIELKSVKMVEDVRSAAERLKNAVLEFRKEQKYIEEEFREEQKRIDSEFQEANYF